ncbi:hypothetical protein JOF56_003650 [Kibdelosporangium banguiense]|uniref:Uncharacterized protein n=1 Tax=Kibdelosporangium banguiense TaxID=1365924 RepID=A0ABS4TFS3_9PSEU|nr:hypothetical protein [Kibdelosporangium banguiense]MBP2323265.1 hypothetical protein [Kibdelosporangium banguiense]
MTQVPVGVRPTKRCLADLGLSLPDLGQPLEEMENSVVAAAQAVPVQRDAGGARRILSLSDRVWFKVKTGDQRAVVTQMNGDDVPDGVPWGAGTWWIGAAGHRQADSPQRDFYESIRRECTVGKTVSTARLLPDDWDWKRFTAEQAVAWRREMKRIVTRLIAMSLTTGSLAVAEFRHHRIKALVRVDDGHEAYLAIIAEGIPDPAIFALLLDCVPGIAPDEWQPEPSQLAAMDPSPGEIIWSTLFPSEVASAILELDVDS